MGGANSRASAEEINSARGIAEGLVTPLLDTVQEGMTKMASVGGGSEKNVLEFAFSSIKHMDEVVVQFVSQCHKTILDDNLNILNAYYEASEKAREVAVEVRCHTESSITELRNLKAVVRSYKKGTEKSCQLALDGLSCVDVEKIDMPQSLVGRLEEAVEAYKNVIMICNTAVEDLKQSRENVKWAWKVVGLCGMLVLNMAISVLAPPIGAVVAGVSIGTETATAIAVSIGAWSVGVALTSVPLTRRIQEINELAKTIKEQHELLRRAKEETEHIVFSIKSLKEKVVDLKNKLERIAKDTSRAIKFEDMEDITSQDFFDSLDTQLRELESLSKTCDELCHVVKEAYEFFRKKSGFITHRIMSGKTL